MAGCGVVVGFTAGSWDALHGRVAEGGFVKEPMATAVAQIVIYQCVCRIAK